jgi:hypothetical protein
MKFEHFYIMGLVIGIILVCIPSLFAVEDEEDFIVRTKTLSGEVNMIRAHYITIDITEDPGSTSSAEMYFPITEVVEFGNVDLVDIDEGNVVQVTYDEYSRLDEGGEERYVTRVTKKVKFLNRGTSDKLISR